MCGLGQHRPPFACLCFRYGENRISRLFFAKPIDTERVHIMVIVRFNQWEEFLEELKASVREDRTVRLTLSLRYDGQQVPHLSMVVGYTDRTTIIEFVHYLGLQPRDRESSRSKEIQALTEERRKYLEGLGFRVKSGRYHVPPTLQR